MLRVAAVEFVLYAKNISIGVEKKKYMKHGMHNAQVNNDILQKSVLKLLFRLKRRF